LHDHLHRRDFWWIFCIKSKCRLQKKTSVTIYVVHAKVVVISLKEFLPLCGARRRRWRKEEKGVPFSVFNFFLGYFAPRRGR
jgi:hypothetical protein